MKGPCERTALEESELAVCLLVALRALGGRSLSGSSFFLVAIDANAGLTGRVVECSLHLGLHRCSNGLCVAVRTLLVRGRQRLLGLRSMMAGVALYSAMLGMLKLNAAHGRAFQHDGCCRRFLLSQNIGGCHSDYGHA
jgi:hypothetical protein